MNPKAVHLAFDMVFERVSRVATKTSYKKCFESLVAGIFDDFMEQVLSRLSDHALDVGSGDEAPLDDAEAAMCLPSCFEALRQDFVAFRETGHI